MSARRQANERDSAWAVRPSRTDPARRHARLVAVPASHADLLDRPLPAALTTHFGKGRLQSSVVWYWRDGDDVCFSTMREFVKATNLRERPRATLLIWDDTRWLELRCAATQVEQTPDEALAACDDVGFLYCGVRPYFGAVVPAEWAEREHPVTFRFTPQAVAAGAFAQIPAFAPGPAHDEPTAPAGDEPSLPDDHLDLFTAPAVRLLATLSPDGHARVHPVPAGLVGHRLATRPTADQAADLARDARATLLVVDRANSARWMEVRADTLPGGDGCATLVPRRVVLDAIHP